MQSHQAQQTLADPDDFRELSMDIVAGTHLTDDILLGASAQMRAEACSKLVSVRLDELQLQYLPVTVLEHLRSCKRLYLQHNCLNTCSNLAVLAQLTMLVLSHNQLKQVEGLQALASLLFLDISFNLVQQLDGSQLPASTKYLNVAGNPLDSRSGLLQQLTEHLPQLKKLDGIPVSSTDAATGSATGGTPTYLSSSLEHVEPCHKPEEHNGSDGIATPGQDATVTTSRHLVGLQQLEQQYTAQAAEAYTTTLSSSNGSSRSGLQLNVTEEDLAAPVPAPAPPLGKASGMSKVAVAPSSQQLAARIVLMHSSISSPTLQHMLQAATLTSQEVPPRTCGFSTPDLDSSQHTGTAILRKSFSLTARNATENSSIPSSRQCALQRKGPKLLSTPRSAGAAAYVPVQPRLGRLQQSPFVISTPTSRRDCGSQGQSLAAPTYESAAAMECLQHVPLAAGVATRGDKPSAAGKQGKELRTNSSTMTQVQSAGSQGPAVSKANIHAAAPTAATPGVVNGPQAGAKGSLDRTIGRQLRQLSSSSKQTSSGSIRSTSNQERSKQQDSSNNSSTHQQVSTRGIQRCCSIAPKAIKHSGCSPRTRGSAGASANISRISQQERPKLSVATAASTLPSSVEAFGVGKLPSHPHRLPSLKAAANHAAAGEAVPSSAKQHTSGQAEVVSVLSRPVSAAGKLTPVQHPVLAPVYEQRRSTSRPSTSGTTSSGSATCSRHCSRTGSADGSIKAADGMQACPDVRNNTSYNSNGSAGNYDNAASLVDDKCEALQGCAASTTAASSLLSAVPSMATLHGSTADSNPAAVLDALAFEGKQSISSAAQAMRQRAKQRVQQLRHHQAQHLLTQKQQLLASVAQLKKQASNHLHGRTMLAGQASGHINSISSTSAPKAQTNSCATPSELATALVSRANRLKERMAAARQQLQDEAAHQPLACQNLASEGVGEPLTEADDLADTICSSSKHFTGDEYNGCDVGHHTQCAASAATAAGTRQLCDSSTLQLHNELVVDLEVQNVIAKIFRPSQLPEFSMDAPQHATSRNAIVKSDIALSMFKLSLPPGL